MEQKIVPLFAFAIGVFSLMSALLDWDWFMNHRKVALVRTSSAARGSGFFTACSE